MSLFVAAAGSVSAQHYNVTELPWGTDAARNYYPTDLNDSNEIVGTSSVQGNFIWQNYTWGYPGQGGMDPAALNDAGVIVGSVGNPSIPYGSSASIEYPSSPYSLTTPAGTGNSAFRAINNNGVAVGLNNAGDSFEWNGTTLSSLPLNQAFAINDSGEVAGAVNTNQYNYTQAATYSNGVVTKIAFSQNAYNATAIGISASGETLVNESGVASTPQGPIGTYDTLLSENGVNTLIDPLEQYHDQMWGTDINASGEVVGYGEMSDGDDAFLYENGQVIRLSNLVGFRLSQAVAINDDGSILAVGADGNWYLLTLGPGLVPPPHVPESGRAAWLLALGLGLFALAGGRRLVRA